PPEVGDFMLPLNAGFTQRTAFVFQLISGASAVLGGVVGYFVLDAASTLLPSARVVAAASFIYIALSDLLPEMMRRRSLAQSLPEVGLILVGVALAGVIMSALHSH
ncbi:MAG: ZIP family metal transporter, partial [Betaproteobacteria bacterium]